MSSLLTPLKKRPETEAPLPARWVTVLLEDAQIEAPKFEMLLEFRHPEAMDIILKPYRKFVSPVDMMMMDWPYTKLPQEQRLKFLKTFFKAAKDWRGFGRKNVARLFPNAVENEDAWASLPDVIPFSLEHRDDFAEMLDPAYFPTIYRAVTDTEEWGVELQARKKPAGDGRD